MEFDQLSKEQLITSISEAHDALNRLIDTMSTEQLTQQGVYGELAVKDVLAHLSAWENLETGWLNTSLAGETPVRFAPSFELIDGDNGPTVDRVNEQVFSENRDKSAEQIISETRAAQASLVGVVNSLSEQDINDRLRFDWWEGEPIWTSIAENSYDHYREHTDLIERWLSVDQGL